MANGAMVMHMQAQPTSPNGRRIRTWLKNAAVRALVPWAERAEPLGRNVFGILTYHRTCVPESDRERPTFNVTPTRLREQLSGLLRRGFLPWPLSRALDHCRRGLAIPRKTFVVTFDDGYANNVTQALPVLEELAIPATIFLATAYLDTDQPFPFDDWQPQGDRWRCRDAWVPLTRAQCRTACASGLIELGCHTHTHQAFRHRPELFRDDLRAASAALQREFEIEQPLFSFPFGIADEELIRVARQAGMRCGLTTQPRLVHAASDPFTWGRFHVAQSDSSATLTVKLSGWYDALRQLSRPFQSTISPGTHSLAASASVVEAQS